MFVSPRSNRGGGLVLFWKESYIKHTSKMHKSLLKCKCDIMHDDLNSFKQKPTQKFCEKLINFEKLQIFQKIPKVRSKNEMHDKKSENEIIPKEEDDL